MRVCSYRWLNNINERHRHIQIHSVLNKKRGDNRFLGWNNSRISTCNHWQKLSLALLLYFLCRSRTVSSYGPWIECLKYVTIVFPKIHQYINQIMFQIGGQNAYSNYIQMLKKILTKNCDVNIKLNNVKSFEVPRTSKAWSTFRNKS